MRIRRRVALLVVLGPWCAYMPEASGLPEEERNATPVVRPDYRNEAPGPYAVSAEVGAAFFSGHVTPTNPPSDGKYYGLPDSAFGHPCSKYVAYDGISDDVIDRARWMLFPQTSDGGGGRLMGWGLTFEGTEAFSPLKSSPGDENSIRVTPVFQRVANTAGSVAFSVDIEGYTMDGWDAEVERGGEFLTITGGASGDADGPITVGYAANPESLPRWGTVRVTGDVSWGSTCDGSPIVLVIAQDPAEPIVQAAPQDCIVPVEGGPRTVSVHNAGTGSLAWTAQVEDVEPARSFLTLEDAAGTDDGAFTVYVAANFGAPRSGRIFVSAPDAANSPVVLRVEQRGGTAYDNVDGLTIQSPGTIVSNLTVPDAFTIEDVNVRLYIQHTWVEDLTVSLRSPRGTEVLLFSGVGGGDDDFGASMGNPLTLDAEAADSIVDGSPPFADVAYVPQGFLAAFNAQDAQGLWTLRITDARGGRAVEDPPPAFRLIERLYTLGEHGTPVNQIEDRLLSESQIDQLLADLYSGADEAQVREAERLVRNALMYAPFDHDLRELLLDIYYNRCVANVLIAKERLVRANKKRFDPPAPGRMIIDEEIAFFEDAFDAYRSALGPYFELFADGLGTRPAVMDPDYTGTAPLGYRIFQTHVPYRPLYAATYRDADDNPVCVLGGAGENAPKLLPGYKDWALLFQTLADTARTAHQLAKLYLMRGAEHDMATVQDFISDVSGYLDTHGHLLRGIFPDFDDSSGQFPGVEESIAAWGQATDQLKSVSEFFQGTRNLLGFHNDFLMLVQHFADTKDSFDALMRWNDPDDVTSPLGAAVAKFDEAFESYETYRGGQDELAIQFARMTNAYRDRLSGITGVDPGPDPTRPVDTAYFTPGANVGSEISLQLTSISVAQNRIDHNRQEIGNLHQKVQIEVDRRARETQINADISSLIIDYGEKQAQLTQEIAEIEAKQAMANEMVAGLSDLVTFGVGSGAGGATFNPVSLVAHGVNSCLQAQWIREKGRLQGDKERQAALERAEIKALDDQLLDNQSKANIKTWLLEMKTLQLESAEAGLLLSQEVGRLASLLGEQGTIEAHMAEISENLVGRYFADPTHRLRYQSDMLEAAQAFDRAQLWCYFTLRAFEFKYSLSGFVTPDGYSVQSVYGTRNAEELLEIITAVRAFDMQLGLPGSSAKEDWISFTEDILGYRRLDDAGQPMVYARCPYSGKPDQTAAQILRNYLAIHQQDAGTILLEGINTAKDNGVSFFLGPRYADGTLVSPGSCLDRINAMKINVVGAHTVPNVVVGGTLTQGGVQQVRNIWVGTIDDDPSRIRDEKTTWSSRFWFFDPGNMNAEPPILPAWRFNEGLTANIVLNLTSSTRDATTANLFDDFAERSVAATDWTLAIYAGQDGRNWLNVSEIDDIEIYFNHRSKTRPLPQGQDKAVAEDETAQQWRAALKLLDRN